VSLRFALLGSGSKGNATLIQSGATTLMIDCGFSLAETERRLARLAVRPAALTAILVTHEHGDHADGVMRLARRHGIAVWCSVGTRRAANLAEAATFHADAAVVFGDLEVMPVTVPHDAYEPTQFVVSDGRHRVGVLTDLGHPTPHVLRAYAGLDALVLECNHDADALARGPYPQALKDRVGGRRGHLSNAQAAELVAGTDCSRLQHLVAAHLSETNNSPAAARAALAGALGCASDWIQVADQVQGLDWRALA
jgi:phosphoribosyl 1,2-cyclic phosphodiesterase